MTPDRLAEVDEVLAAALDLDEPARAGFLAHRCAADPELRREVEALLVHCGGDGHSTRWATYPWGRIVPAKGRQGVMVLPD